jgi:hypothetical protein
MKHVDVIPLRHPHHRLEGFALAVDSDPTGPFLGITVWKSDPDESADVVGDTTAGVSPPAETQHLVLPSFKAPAHPYTFPDRPLVLIAAADDHVHGPEGAMGCWKCLPRELTRTTQALGARIAKREAERLVDPAQWYIATDPFVGIDASETRWQRVRRAILRGLRNITPSIWPY